MAREDKLQRLELVARLYHEEGLNQADIAKRLGVSRPFVSRMLSEAREVGIVEITIRSLAPAYLASLQRAKQVFGVQGGRLVGDAGEDALTNQWLGDAALELVDDLGGGRLGLGWGQMIGVTVATLERRPAARTRITDVAPLVGNRGVPIRNYHSNENTRVFAQQCKARPHFLHTPALAETRDELDLLKQTANYRAVYAEWERLDLALANIGNHPSTPDFASVARYGTLLARHRAVGRLIAYFFDQSGAIIHSENDYAIQIPLEILEKCPRVIGLCAANVSPKALAGALRTGLITHLIAPRATLDAALQRFG
ncbi:MAG: MarR family transcriptional regulator [Bifidobacteriaceae bacterium]|nr:MarR family transcriptional regulator [Bifidobacteriaceae bacterium]